MLDYEHCHTWCEWRTLILSLKQMPFIVTKKKIEKKNKFSNKFQVQNENTHVIMEAQALHL
jgi:hypothetical protein